MGHRNAQFCRGQRDGNGGIDVADSENKVRFGLDEDRFDALEDFGGLRGMRARADFKIKVRLGYAHLTEEDIGKRIVLMLAGVNEEGLNLRMTAHLTNELGNFR